MTPEAKVKADIKKWLKEHGFWPAGGKKPEGDVNGWYFMPVSNGMGIHGIPDFVCIFHGTSFFIEAKAPKGVLSENQKLRHEEIRAAGGMVVVIRDAAELDTLFESEFPMEATNA
jgi:hypothetical protein